MSETAKTIRDARRMADMSQEDLAEKVGTKGQNISRWEQGRVSPSAEKFLEILRVCGFTISLTKIAS